MKRQTATTFGMKPKISKKKLKEVKTIIKSRCILKDVIKMRIRGIWNFLVILIVFVLAMVGAMPSAWAASESDSSSATIYVPDDYPTIQAAVDAASSGDTIIVRDGEYRENINVKKRVTIKSENGSGNCIVNAEDREDDVFWVFADYVNISGFTVRGATGWGEAGIYLYSADYCNISNNICSNNECGIYLDYSSGNTISGNTFVNDGLFVHSSYHNTVGGNTVNGKPLVYLEGASDYRVEDAGQVILINCRNITTENQNLSDTCNGIVLLGTEDSIIADNTVSNNEYGIYLRDSSNNSISGNDVSGNNDDGIYLDDSSNNNSISGNNVSGNNDDGIYLDDSSNNNSISGNDVSNNNDDGIYLDDSSNNNSISGNDVSNNGDGIYLDDSSNNNSISGNDVSGNNDDGIYLRDSSNNSISGNDVSGNNDDGIYLRDSSNNSISGNDVSGNNDDGIYLRDSNNNSISSNAVCNNDDGIDLHHSSSNSISSNSISSNSVCNNSGQAGIYLYSADYCNISNNICSNNEYGISLQDFSNNNSISSNTVCNNRYYGISLYDSIDNIVRDNTLIKNGFYLLSSSQTAVENNSVNGKPLVYLEDASDYTVEDAGQVILLNCTNITVENLDLSNTSTGIQLWKTTNSKIVNNVMSNNSGYGISLDDSSNNNSISGNDVSNNGDGISLDDSRNNSISSNTVCNNNYDGIVLLDSSNNSISSNTVCNNNYDGIDLDYSSGNTISGNTFVNDGLFVHSSYHNTVGGNTVNNKPLVYLEDASDYKIEEAGQVILINCKNITAENLNLSDTCDGIVLLGTEDSIIADNTVSSITLYRTHTYVNGIFALHRFSNNNTISGNTVSGNNDIGIAIWSSNNNTISDNTVSGNNDIGIAIGSSSNNTISGNTVKNNDICIDLQNSRNNTIYLNNFINNTDNVDAYESTNIWNSTEEITYTYKTNQYTNYMGNYWSDYTGTDSEGDGIGDRPYPANSDNDNYPLMERFENYFKPTPPTAFITCSSSVIPVKTSKSASRL